MSEAGSPLERLPEFPLGTFESLGDLRRSDRGPFVTLEPPRIEAARPTTPLPAAESRSSYGTRRYHAWATYPSVVCHDPGPFVDGLEIASDDGGEARREQPSADLGEVAREVQHYRLSAFEGTQLPRPLWCTVTHGPWLATLTETESCIDGDPSRWELSIHSPEVGVVWFGGVDDMPDVPGLDVVRGTMVLAKTEPPSACPGYFWCPFTREFKRTGEPCGPISPA